MNSVTLVMTACDRLDLLKKTLSSFIKVNTHPISEMIIRDDSGLNNILKETHQLLTQLNLPFPFKLMGGEQLGQINSIDRMMIEVKTPWVFHSEDDWEYLSGGFIKKAIDLWQDDFIQAWIRRDGIKTAKLKKCNGYTITDPTRFSFNPHLRSMKTYTPYKMIEKVHWSMEESISIWCQKKGFRTLWLKNHIKHIGEHKPTNRPLTPYHKGVIKA